MSDQIEAHMAISGEVARYAVVGRHQFILDEMARLYADLAARLNFAPHTYEIHLIAKPRPPHI